MQCSLELTSATAKKKSLCERRKKCVAFDCAAKLSGEKDKKSGFNDSQLSINMLNIEAKIVKRAATESL
jgi:hypothetical protein